MPENQNLFTSLCKRIFIANTRPLLDETSVGHMGSHFSVARFYALNLFDRMKDNGIKIVLHGLPGIEILKPIADIHIDIKEESLTFLIYDREKESLVEMLKYFMTGNIIIDIWVERDESDMCVLHLANFLFPMPMFPRAFYNSAGSFSLPLFPACLELSKSNQQFIQLNESTPPVKVTNTYTKEFMYDKCKKWAQITSGKGFSEGNIVWYDNALYKINVISVTSSATVENDENKNKHDNAIHLVKIFPKDESYQVVSADTLLFHEKTLLCPDNILIVGDKSIEMIMYSRNIIKGIYPAEWPDEINFLLSRLFNNENEVANISKDTLDLCTRLILKEYVDNLPYAKSFTNDAIVIFNQSSGFAFNYVNSVSKIIEKAEKAGIPTNQSASWHGWRLDT